ncbi:MAG: pimeloyl-CoA dehydrogenase small subunit [Hyphomicrobiales bacterium]|nr:pimeloyl-CoA dehydrogenase small subunit [Hyphomicrobiales bacterium]
MDFTHSDDRRMLADMASRFVREKYDIESRHKNAATDDGFNRKTWAEFAELGLIGALFDEASGGFGGKGFDIAVVFEELGKGLVVEPMLTNLVAGRLIENAGDNDQKMLLEKVIGGDLLLAFAHGEPQSRYNLSHVATRAEKIDSGWKISGHKSAVMNGDSADLLVVSARLEGGDDDLDGIGLFLVNPRMAGVNIRSCPTVDGGRIGDVSLDNVEVSANVMLGDGTDSFKAIETAIAAGIVAVSAEALGAMQIATEMTLEYLKTRKQFGVNIGRFQVLQHRFAEMLIEIEQVRSSLINAAGHLESGRELREWNVSALKNMVGRVGHLVAEECIQMHGGIGMTWEYALPHFAKRLTMIDHLFGDEDYHIERVVALSA